MGWEGAMVSKRVWKEEKKTSKKWDR